jgi:hypothetical protein
MYSVERRLRIAIDLSKVRLAAMPLGMMAVNARAAGIQSDFTQQSVGWSTRAGTLGG